MDVKYINPFVVATQTVFKTMLNMEPRMGKAHPQGVRRYVGGCDGCYGSHGGQEGIGLRKLQ